jgi:hypothetical protein
MRIFLPLLLCFSLFSRISAQDTDSYFQQEVNYRITVSLDDVKDQLSGSIEIEYINNSPDALTEIYMHLWPNAYSKRTTAFAQQKLRMGSTRFYFAEDSQLGGLDSLDFRVDGKKIAWDYDAEHPDIALLKLPQPLRPGEQLTIQTPFLLNIPASFSRLGHIGDSYQFTQWYPKPAVYDKDGWHPMPYLDMGEFYSEFGAFEVEITLPANYVVAATGTLHSRSERAFLEERIRITDDLIEKGFSRNRDDPPSDQEMKTLRYTADKVHDFAWFADKRFHVQKSMIKLGSGREIDTWAFFTNYEANLWKKATKYLDRSVKFYSRYVGEYPWPHATAVQSALSAGGGMEYPMITVIGSAGEDQSLDEVITHEVGHNWFYGILAFNERDYPWMDEGINSYYEYRYMEQNYGTYELNFLPEFLLAGSDMSLYESAYLLQARRRLDQTPQQNSNNFTGINYFLGAYAKPAASLRLLERYVGTQRFDQVMRAFFQKWQFRHPAPEDFRSFWESNTTKDLSWFFDGLVGSHEKIDYRIQKVKKEESGLKVTIKNKGKVAAPFRLEGLNKKGETIDKEWVDGFTGQEEITFPTGKYHRLSIDPENMLWDLYREDNSIKMKGLFPHYKPPRFKLLGGLDNQRRADVFWSPLAAWNNYDKIMLGAAFYNRLMIAKDLEWGILPLYSFASGKLAGTGEIKYNLYPGKGILHRMTIGMGARAFDYSRIEYQSPEQGEFFAGYQRFSPYLELELKKKAISRIFQKIRLGGTFISQQEPAFTIEGEFMEGEKENYQIWRLDYQLEKRSALNPARIDFRLEQQSFSRFGTDISYVKLGLDARQSITYMRKKNIDLRLFAGLFVADLINSESPLPQSLALSPQAYNDYAYDDYFFGRSEQSGIWARQISLREGGFKNAFGSPYQAQLGLSNDYLFSLNISADLPIRKWPGILPLKPYFDLAVYEPASLGETEGFLWSGGLMLEYFNGAFGIYLPLINSSDIEDTYKQMEADIGGNFLSRISFSLDLNRLHPWRLIDRIEF